MRATAVGRAAFPAPPLPPLPLPLPLPRPRWRALLGGRCGGSSGGGVMAGSACCAEARRWGGLAGSGAGARCAGVVVVVVVGVAALLLAGCSSKAASLASRRDRRSECRATFCPCSPDTATPAASPSPSTRKYPRSLSLAPARVRARAGVVPCALSCAWPTSSRYPASAGLLPCTSGRAGRCSRYCAPSMSTCDPHGSGVDSSAPPALPYVATPPVLSAAAAGWGGVGSGRCFLLLALDAGTASTTAS